PQPKVRRSSECTFAIPGCIVGMPMYFRGTYAWPRSSSTKLDHNHTKLRYVFARIHLGDGDAASLRPDQATTGKAAVGGGLPLTWPSRAPMAAGTAPPSLMRTLFETASEQGRMPTEEKARRRRSSCRRRAQAQSCNCT